MRSTQCLTRLVFTLLLVTSGNAVPDDVGIAESVAYLETLLVQHLDDEREFSRHAIQYLALTGQESIPFVDNLTGNYPLPWLNMIQQFQQSLPDCSEESFLLESVLNFFIRKTSFTLHWEEQWRDWQQELKNHSAMDAVVEFLDDSTGNRVSAVWHQLDETTQARILGAGKVLSVMVPAAKVKVLAELARVPSPALKKNGWHPDSVEARHKEWQEHYGEREDHEYQGISGYIRPPELLKAFPDALIAKTKTVVQGGGQKRVRWADKKGNIYEWDSRHGTVEKYNKRGKHLGEFDPETGKQLEPADNTRHVEP